MNVERRAITTVLLLLGSVALSLSIAEGVCRVANIGNSAVAEWEEERIAGSDTAYLPNSGLIYRYPDNPRGYFNELNEVWGSINASGFRGPDRRLAKPPSVRRVAFLGDSFTLGVGVGDGDTLPAQFERAMQRYLPASQSPELQVLNFGVSDSATPQQVDLLERQALRFQPDVVILVVFLNDADLRGTSEFLRDGKIVPSRGPSFRAARSLPSTRMGKQRGRVRPRARSPSGGSAGLLRSGDRPAAKGRGQRSRCLGGRRVASRFSRPSP